jgi:hypothetical protein
MAFIRKPLWRKSWPKGLFNFFPYQNSPSFSASHHTTQIQPQRREASANGQWPGFLKEGYFIDFALFMHIFKTIS